MYKDYFEQVNKIISFENILKELENFKYVSSTDVNYLIKNPTNVYINEILPLKVKDNLKQKKIASIIKAFNNRHNKDNSLFENIDRNRIKEILNEFDIKQDFSFLDLKSKERRYILKFNDLWTEKEYSYYKDHFIQYLQSKDKFYKHFKQILQLYIRKYSTLKNDNSFKELFKNIYKKYSINKKYVPEFIQNILKDCDLLSKNVEQKLAEICLLEKTNTHKSIVDIITDRYKFIRPHTDLYNEIVVVICDLCKKNINKDFYFSLLFSEILNSDIENDYSAKIVGNIITLFGSEKNVSQTDLEKIKIALLKNSYYGDPRLNKITSNWHRVDKNAKHTFITWLAQADLEFFFKIAFKGVDDPHRRKKFWQQYINSHQLVESQVIWGQKFYQMDEIQKEQERSGIQYKRFVSEEECSCFILKFNNIYIVEFSGYGNALYFYSGTEFNSRIDTQKSYYYKADDLKRKGRYTKQFSKQDNGKVPDLSYCGSFNIYHSGDPGTWEKLAENVLGEYGVFKGVNNGVY